MNFSPETWPLLAAFAIITIVGTIETVGDSMAIQRVSQRDYRQNTIRFQ